MAATPAMMRQIDPEEAANLLARLVTVWESTTGYLAFTDGGEGIEVVRRVGPDGRFSEVLAAVEPDADGGWSVQ